jgi:transcription termination factor Rho
LLLSAEELEGIWAVRKMLSGGENSDSAEKLIETLAKTRTNADFVKQVLMQLRLLQDKGYNFRK